MRKSFTVSYGKSFNSNKKFIIFLAPLVDPIPNPCVPSPCGPFAICRAIGDTPSCSCLQNYIGSPPNCHPECTINADCPSNKACIREKCSDPCPGSCGLGAQCNVVYHTPMCVCPEGFTGDPFSRCVPKPPRKLWLLSFLTDWET